MSGGGYYAIDRVGANKSETNVPSKASRSVPIYSPEATPDGADSDCFGAWRVEFEGLAG